MRLAERVTAGDEGDRLVIVHRHPAEGFADVARSGHRIGDAVGSFGVDVDQAHLNRGERVLQVAVTGVALVGQPLGFRAPVGDVRLVDVSATATEPEGFESHGLHGHIAGQDEQVTPGQLAAVLRLDRPQQPAGLVEVDVVWPGVQRSEALHARASASAPIAGAVGAGTVPGHANEEGAVVAVVGGPPLLRIGHESHEIGLDRGEVEGFEFRRVVEVVSHRAGAGCAVGKDPQIQLVGPPVIVLLADTHGSVVDRALAFGCHRWLSYQWCFLGVGSGVLG